MTITDKQKRWLKGQSHHLKTVVTVGGAGLTGPVLAEIDSALTHHELLKVKVAGADREQRDAMAADMARDTGSQLINRIGNVAVLYRANPKKRDPIALPVD